MHKSAGRAGRPILPGAPWPADFFVPAKGAIRGFEPENAGKKVVFDVEKPPKTVFWIKTARFFDFFAFLFVLYNYRGPEAVTGPRNTIRKT